MNGGQQGRRPRRAMLAGGLALAALALLLFPLLTQRPREAPGRLPQVPSPPQAADPPLDLEPWRRELEAARKAVGEEPALEVETPVAWTVQLGSFQDVARARDLLERLRAQGLPAYLVQGQGGAARLRVGPYLRRAEAEAVAHRLAGKLKVDPLVMRHLPGTEREILLE